MLKKIYTSYVWHLSRIFITSKDTVSSSICTKYKNRKESDSFFHIYTCSLERHNSKLPRARTCPTTMARSRVAGGCQGALGQSQPQTMATSLETGQDICTTKTLPQCAYMCRQSYTQTPFSCILIMSHSSVTHHISGKLRFPWFLFLCY